MSEHTATVSWRREGAAFIDNRYSRAHTWSFDGGARVPASASPHVVPVPYSTPENVDPEEAYLAAIAACHMLFFLSLAAKRGFVVDSYDDQATATMAKDGAGVIWIPRVTLRPRIAFSGTAPTPEDIAALHHAAHAQCFIANSVKTEVVVASD